MVGISAPPTSWLRAKEACLEAITKMWVSIKSQPQNKKLFQVSSKKDNFDYAMKSIDWADELKSGYAPVKLDVQSDCILEEKFTILKDYLFNDEGGHRWMMMNEKDWRDSAITHQLAVGSQKYQFFSCQASRFCRPGDKVKVYVTFPEAVPVDLGKASSVC